MLLSLKVLPAGEKQRDNSSNISIKSKKWTRVYRRDMRDSLSKVCMMKNRLKRIVTKKVYAIKIGMPWNPIKK